SAVRRARPSSPPHGAGMLGIALLLLAQLGVLYGFIDLQSRLQWGAGGAGPPGLAFVTQAVRALLLLGATRLWLGVVHDELRSTLLRALVAAAVVALGWGGGALPVLGVIALAALMSRMKWPARISGWRRGVVLALSAAVLAALSIVPVTTV